MAWFFTLLLGGLVLQRSHPQERGLVRLQGRNLFGCEIGFVGPRDETCEGDLSGRGRDDEVVARLRGLCAGVGCLPALDARRDDPELLQGELLELLDIHVHFLERQEFGVAFLLEAVLAELREIVTFLLRGPAQAERYSELLAL